MTCADSRHRSTISVIAGVALAVLAACDARRTRSGPDVDAARTTPTAAEASPWSGEVLPAQESVATKVTFALGDGDTVVRARLTSAGWIGLRRGPGGLGEKLELVRLGPQGQIAPVEPTGLTTALGSASLLGGQSEEAPLLAYSEKTFPLVRGKVQWARSGARILALFELGPRALGVAQTKETWQTFALDGERMTPIASGAKSEDRAVGVARLGSELIVAVTDADAQSLELIGRGRAVVGPSPAGTGTLVHLDGQGQIARRESFVGQRPNDVTATADGWLLVLTQGTIARDYRDAMLVGRPPTGGDFRLLLKDLDTPLGLVERGSWICFYEASRLRRVHCVSPERRLHLKTESNAGIHTLFDIEPSGAAARLLFRRGLDTGPSPAEIMALALP